MRMVLIIVVLAGLLSSLAATAKDEQTTRLVNKIEPLPRDLEIQLALSALPSHIRLGFLQLPHIN